MKNFNRSNRKGISKKFKHEVFLDEQRCLSLNKIKDTYFSLDSNVIIGYKKENSYKKMFEKKHLNLYISPTVQREVNLLLQATDLKKYVKYFRDLCTELCMKYDINPNNLAQQYERIKDGIKFKKKEIKGMKKELKIPDFDSLKIEENDVLILAETCCLKDKISERCEQDNRERQIYFVTEDNGIRNLIPRDIIEIKIPECLDCCKINN